MREVLRYFLRNREAADNLEGVVRWRLREEAIHRSVEEINDAISWLVAQKLLLRKRVRGSGSVFSLNKERTADAEKLLAAEDRRGSSDD
ncbi:MAG TPA: hypothetical protein VKA21_00220 [Candidatus Binatia bacterium]|nr:hypothetical protein [Candidatus Binatia bacterium]